ncbi:MAG TPA: glycoside hydrolase domain-containing protein [Solirubrobacterales bacterium]|nr:glycoside hydrolase domain-containing protein [Solirubrobacterales bacterium]
MITGHGKRLHAHLFLGALLLLVALAMAAGAARAEVGAGAAGGAGGRTVHFGGRAVHVPAGYRVVRVTPHSRTCVRLDRRVVYLGGPSAQQRCPAGPILGRRRAIVVSAHGRRITGDSRALSRAGAGGPLSPARPRIAHARRSASASVAGSIFTGLGFDTCSAPSSKAMAAWAESPFRGVGIYIGGENSACSQPNLSSSWVSAQTTAGWHLIPTYVGLQATTSSCSSCAKMTTVAAGTQGTAAAEDAVAEAGAIGIGASSPIYFDLESYTPTTSATHAALTFLEAWTAKLHQLGYQSGVYSSSGSGIADVADQVGTGYQLPDAIWIADWNNQQSTAEAVVPESAWANHQRIHQYRGGHDDTYGGVTINVDSDYVDGPTVGVGTPPVGESDPIGTLELTGAPAKGQLRVKGWALDPDAPTETLAIDVVVGGREGQKGVETYELGQVADQARPDVAASHKLAGANHGFDARLVTIKSGPEPVCVYAVNVALGGNRLLGCRTTTIPVAVTLSGLRATRSGIAVNVSCEFPAGTECPGQLGLRTTFRVATPRRRKPPRIHAVTRSLGRRTFHLSGASWHRFVLPLSARGRKLLRKRGKLRTLLVASIPGGQRTAGLPLRSRAARR